MNSLNDCRLRGQIAQNILSRRASENGFSKYSGEAMAADAIDLYARPCAFRSFRDIGLLPVRVISTSLKLLGVGRNIKKISFSYARTASRIFCAICRYSLTEMF